MSLDIVIVDDSKLVHAMILQSLEMTDVDIGNIHKAMNGKEGLEILRNNPADLVFSDLHMPEMDGEQMIEAIRNDARIQHLPIVVISSEGSHKRIEELKHLGVKHYIRKPFTPEMINEVIHQVLGEE